MRGERECDSREALGADGAMPEVLHDWRRVFFCGLLHNLTGGGAMGEGGEAGGGGAADSAPGGEEAAWATPFAATNAGLNQLMGTGWCHHIMRHLIACYLTRVLDVSWEVGRWDWLLFAVSCNNLFFQISLWTWIAVLLFC